MSSLFRAWSGTPMGVTNLNKAQARSSGRKKGNHMTLNSASAVQRTSYLVRPEGRIGYDVEGSGPLVVLVPGMGDLRSAYRFLAPTLRNSGFRVACTDLRGHGDSDTTFASYGDVETAGDIVALIEELDGPAVVAGNSMGAGAAIYAAAERRDLVNGLVLVGPFVRNGKTNAFQRVLLRVGMAPPWAATSWNSYLPKLYKGRLPVDFDEYRKTVASSLRRPGYAKSFSLTTRTDHAFAESRLREVVAPTLVIMGEQDPDFPDPRAEAEWISQALKATVVMVPEAGHYPQSQRPDITADAVLRFLKVVNVQPRDGLNVAPGGPPGSQNHA
jgi:pimeloyl-ACP methyl ester carboxylesterase